MFPRCCTTQPANALATVHVFVDNCSVAIAVVIVVIVVVILVVYINNNNKINS
jgi:hypothetical protein